MQKITAFFVALFLWCNATDAFAKTIRLVADVWCPYNCERDAENPGFMIEIAKKAFEKRGITVEYFTMPWDQAVEETRQGKYTAIVGASINDAPDFIFPTIEQGWASMQFFTTADSRWNYVGKASLQQVSLGVISGYAYGPTVDSYIKHYASDPSRVQIAEGNGALAENIEKLLSGKLGAILEDGHVMNYYLERNKLTDKIRKAGQLPISDQNNLYIAISPKEKSAKSYATILAEEMTAMRESGELAEILKKYSITDWRR